MSEQAFKTKSFTYNPSSDNAEYLLSLPISQLKAIKKAIAVLMRAGITRDIATITIIDAHRRRRS